MDTSPRCSCVHRLELIKQVTMAERKEQAPSLPHPTCSKRCDHPHAARPDLSWACTTPIALHQAGGRDDPTKGPVSTRTNMRERARHVWEQRSERGGQDCSYSSWWEMLAITCNFIFRDFFLRNLLFFEEYMWVSGGYAHRLFKDNNFGRDSQVEVAQFNTLLQAGEIRLLRHFSGQVLKISEYGDSLPLWPLLQDLFTHTMKKFFLLSNAPACVCCLLSYYLTSSRWVAWLSHTLPLNSSTQQERSLHLAKNPLPESGFFFFCTLFCRVQNTCRVLLSKITTFCLKLYFSNKRHFAKHWAVTYINPTNTWVLKQSFLCCFIKINACGSPHVVHYICSRKYVCNTGGWHPHLHYVSDCQRHREALMTSAGVRALTH